jgi:hypothetical protein
VSITAAQGSLRTKKLVVSVLAFVSLGMWLGRGVLFEHYHGTCPKTPNLLTGHVIASNNHGSIVYLNRAEQLRLDALSWATVSLFCIGLILVRFWKLPTRPEWHNYPPEVRERISRGPNINFDKIRATYQHKDSDDA